MSLATQQLATGDAGLGAPRQQPAPQSPPHPQATPSAGLDRLVHVAAALEHSLSGVLLGKPETVRLTAAAILTGGHVLLDDLPGVGKTTLATAVARVVGGSFRRVQGSPDLLPTDLTGAVVPDQRTGEWVYRPGPLLANVVLVDEINRISSRTQSALLQTMAEGQISIDGEVRDLPKPSLVIATMNPAGSAGTFELLAGQLDRFDVATSIGAVGRDEERALLRRPAGPDVANAVRPVLPIEAWPLVHQAVSQLHVADAVLDFALDLCEAIRATTYLSVRASRSLLAIARGFAVLNGRDHVIPEDVRAAAPACLAHRVGSPSTPHVERVAAIEHTLRSVAVPLQS